MRGESAPFLTQEQRWIVEKPPEAQILVIAGPGTGKTHTLVARAAHLADAYDISPAEMLTLSFSRAAVAEIRKRANASDGISRYITAYTFDAFASRLLALAAPDERWKRLNYDDRIRAATDLLRRHEDARNLLIEFRHMLLDEIQDLVTERAAFVETILGVAAGGFTLFGDPAQAIYNFQRQGDTRAEGSDALYRHLHERYADTLVELTLEHNHRAEKGSAMKALPFGPLLRADKPDFVALAHELETVALGLTMIGAVPDAASWLRLVPGTTALLCRTNGEALMLSRMLHSQAIPHRLQRSSADRVAPAWIAAVLGPLDQPQISRRNFFNRAVDFLPEDLTSELAWDRLKWVEGERGNTLDVARVADAIRIGNLPEDFNTIPPATVVISTVHRAKGLEFDRVVLVEPRKSVDWPENDDTRAEEARVRFVAMTRPRSALSRMGGPDTRGLFFDHASDRWLRKYDWKIVDVEFRGVDVHWDSPPGCDFGPQEDPFAIQTYLHASVRPGDPVTLNRWFGAGDPDADGYYLIKHNGRMIGITSEACSRMLARLFRHRWPTGFKDLRVEVVETVAGTAAMTQRAGLGATGLWLRVRVAGLGNCTFAPLGAPVHGGFHVPG